MSPKLFGVLLSGVVVCALATPRAHAGFSATEVFVPSVGAAPGLAPAVWYTTVWVHNPGATRADVTFYLLERKENLSPLTATDSIPAGDTRRYDNAVESLFGVRTFGALRITSNVRVMVGSRVYSQPGTAVEDSTGQFFAGIPASFSIGAGESTEIIGGWQVQPTAASAFRLNYGFVETTGVASCEVMVTVSNGVGTTLATKSYQLRRWEQVQKAFAGEFAAISSDNVRLSVAVTSGSGRVIAFGSSVANGLQDPSTLEMGFAESLLAENAQSGTITGVVAGEGLAGGGTSGTVTLAIARNGVSSAMINDGAVSAADVGFSFAGSSGKGGPASDLECTACVRSDELSAQGGSLDKVLKHNGERVVWGDDVSFQLPYSRGVSSVGWLLDIQNTNSSGYGTILAGSSGGVAIEGYGGCGSCPGVRGTNRGNTGELGGSQGVYGKHSASGNFGLLGTSQQGVYGENGGTGAKGSLGSASYGVYGNDFGGSHAGYFNGPVDVNGTLTKSGGSFKIDHPLDPTGRYLQHSFVESPDMMNVYNGVVILDEGGEAWVELPMWFEALNRDFRYQLTCVGEFAPIYVAEKVSGNRFKIAGGRTGLEVSWQLTGIRHDAWANAHRIQVEEDKPEGERGTLLAPEVWGLPSELGLEWRQEQELDRAGQPPSESPGADR